MGSDRGGDIVSSLGPVTVVPLPPERSGSIETNRLPYSIIKLGAFDVRDINPPLPENCEIRLVVNGINGKVAFLPIDNEKVIWQNEGRELKLIYNASYPDSLELISNSAFTINTLDVYIDGVKMTLI